MNFTFALYFLILASLAWATYRWPSAALGAILCTNGLEQWAQSQDVFFIENDTLTNFATAGVLLLALGLKIRRGEKILMWPRPVKAGFALLLFALLSTLWSVYDGAVGQWLHAGPYLLTIAILSPLLISSIEDLKVGFYSTLALGAILLLLLILTTHTGINGRGVELAAGIDKIGGGEITEGNPLAVASMSAYAIIIAMLMNFKAAHRFWGLARWLLLAMGIFLIVRSGSRGQLLALVVVMPIFLLLSRRPRSLLKLVFMSGALLATVTISSWIFTQYAEVNRWNIVAFQSEIESDEQSVRLQYVRDLMSYWEQSSPQYWLFGLGNSAAIDPQIIGSYPHIVPAEVLAEEGLLGFLLFCVFILLMLRSTIRLYVLSARDAELRGLVTVAGALFFYEFILCFKQGSLIGSAYLFAFAFILGRFEQVCVCSMRSQVSHLRKNWNVPRHRFGASLCDSRTQMRR